MTQHDAKKAVRHIQRNFAALKSILMQRLQPPEVYPLLDTLGEDLMEFEASLNTPRQIATPNCRPATAAELQRLCASSNVVVFKPAA